MEITRKGKSRIMTTSNFVAQLSCCVCGWEKATVKVGEKTLCKGCYSRINSLNDMWIKAFKECDMEVLTRILKA